MNKNLIKITAVMLSALTFSTVIMPSSSAARRGRPPKEITADKKSADNKKPDASKSNKTTEYYDRECDFELHMADKEIYINYFLRQLNSILHKSLNASRYASFILKLNKETHKNTLYISKLNKCNPQIYVNHDQLVLDKNWQVYRYSIEKESDISYREKYNTAYINYDKQIVIVTRKIPTEKNENITRIETLLSFTNYIKENKDKGLLSDTFYAHIPVNNVENTICYDKPNYSLYDYLRDFQKRNNFRSKYCNNSTPIQTPDQSLTESQDQSLTESQDQTPTQIPTRVPLAPIRVPTRVSTPVPLTPTQPPTRVSTPVPLSTTQSLPPLPTQAPNPTKKESSYPSITKSLPCRLYLNINEIDEKFFDKLNEIKDDIFITTLRNYKLSKGYYNRYPILNVETEDTKNWQITLNPEIEMNENWYKILFYLPGNKDLNTYGKIYVNLKNQIVVTTKTINGTTWFLGIGSMFSFILSKVVYNPHHVPRLSIVFFYKRADKIMKASKYTIDDIFKEVLNSKEVDKFKFVKR